MKITFLVLTAVLIYHTINGDELLKKFENFQATFNRRYKTPEIKKKRFRIFKKNLQKFEAHNHLYRLGKVLYKQGITQFADQTEDELNRGCSIEDTVIPLGEGARIFKPNISFSPSKKIDWRGSGAVGPVKYQGGCGSCWAFSVTGALEGQAFLRKGLKLTLSEQHLVDCAGATYTCFGCNGGNKNGAFKFVRANGISSQTLYPYTKKKGECKKPEIVLRIRGYTEIPKKEPLLRAAIAMVGPIAVSIRMTDKGKHFIGGILRDTECTTKKGFNHAVLAVGYGTQNGTDYWLIKNSWGKWWGERGFFKLSREHDCGFKNKAIFPNL